MSRDEVPDGARDRRIPGLVDHLFRHESGRLVAALTRVLGTGELQLAEDAVQEALLKALRTWPFRGVPDDPRAWLMRVARNGALDRLRRDDGLKSRLPELERWRPPAAATDAGPEDGSIADGELRMVFTCCHPALPVEARIALTLKTLCGFGVPEIARAFLSEETAIAQRLVRAKRRLREEQVPFAVPEGPELAARLDDVLEVLYLVFNEGYAAHEGEDLVRHDLVLEALRLARSLLAVEEAARPKAHALLALMLFQAARLPARVGALGDLLTLEHQDRSLWDRRAISAGFRHLGLASRGDDLTRYHVEAAIAACHSAAPSWERTDWKTILARYDQLAARVPSPVVRLNRAVALAMVEGPQAGLRELDALERDPALARYYLLPATRGELLARTCDHRAACEAWRRALGLRCSEPERAFLRGKIRACGMEP
jgi:RNA polymerase sigma factor (sigma-70 family)